MKFGLAYKIYLCKKEISFDKKINIFALSYTMINRKSDNRNKNDIF